MKKILVVIGCSALMLLVKSCANVGSPTGGNKDTTAPSVKTMFPENKTTNYSGRSVNIEYSEFIDASALDKEISIVPKVEAYEIEKGSKSIKIKFKKALEENTTYQIFFGKGVKDVNEGNICKLKSFVFSTGSKIDSLSCMGTTKYLLDQKNADCLVGLYQPKPNLDITKDLPYYWLNSVAGKFEFNNLKEGNYEVYAFVDENNNKLYDKKESIAYLSKSINTKTDKSVELLLHKQNTDTLKLISNIDNKDYYQIKFNKGLKNIKVSDNQIFKKENEKIIILKGKEDSLVCNVEAEDSIGYKLKERISIINKNKPTQMKDFVKVKTNKVITGNKYILTTDRIIAKTQNQNINIIYDDKKLDVSELKYVNDSIYFIIPKFKDSLSVNMKKGTYISIQGDSSTLIKTIYKPLEESKYGLMAGTVQYNGKMVLELIRNGNVEFRTTHKNFEAKFLEPGDYVIRVIKDADNNGYLTQGNYKTKLQPEGVYIVPKPVTIKANWDIKDLLITVE